MDVIKTKCRLCGAVTENTQPPNYCQYSKYILIAMIKNKGVPIKYGFTRSKPDLVHILNRLDSGVDPEVIVKEQRDTLYV